MISLDSHDGMTIEISMTHTLDTHLLHGNSAANHSLDRFFFENVYIYIYNV